MPPIIALLLWFVSLVALLYFDPAKESGTSFALWVPLIWMFFVGSRLPSQWIGTQMTTSVATLEEGNVFDRTILFILILLAFGILVSRSFNWRDFISRNSVLVIFLFFALLSAIWSDFPLVTLKRWYRDLGNYFVILVVLSDPHPLGAVRTFLRRISYLLIPLSVLLNKYFPGLSKQYDNWTGMAMFVGPTTSKNMLGVLCLVSGLFFFWDTAMRWADRKTPLTRKVIVVNVLFFAMTLWQANLAQSATSQVCLAIGCLVILTGTSKWCKSHPTFLKLLIPTIFFLYVILAFGFNMNADLARQLGRNSTLTGRTDIWEAVLSTHTNPVVGAGYESFWLGSRLLQVWRKTGVGINEAHNGYLEVYLSLGIVGILLLAMFLLSTYQTIWKRLREGLALASLGLAVWTVVLFYNMTEAAAFKGHLMWLTFLLLSIVVSPRAAVDPSPSLGPKLRNNRIASRKQQGVAGKRNGVCVAKQAFL